MPFDIGPGELVLVLIVALIVFGPGKLPEMGRQIGNAVREFKRMSSAATEEMTRALELDPAVAQSRHPASASSSSPASAATDVATATSLEPAPYQPTAEPLRGAVPGMVFCPKCGAGTAETNNFCSICGTSLKPAAPSGTPEVPLETQPDKALEQHSQQPIEKLQEIGSEKPSTAQLDQLLEQSQTQPGTLPDPDKHAEKQPAGTEPH